MYSNELSNLLGAEGTGVAKYAGCTNFFRTDFSDAEYITLPRRTFASFRNVQDYNHYHCLFPRVVFIDLGDVRRFLAIEKQPGLSEINVMKIAGVVCTFIGDNTVLTNVLWNVFEEEIASAIMAELGVESDSSLLGDPFNEALAAVFDIATIIGRYLVHAQYPLVEEESIYGPAKYQNGIIALKIKEYSALAIDYHGAEHEYSNIRQPLLYSQCG